MKASYSHIEKGTLLIATPSIDSGLYFRSVILICEHNSNGSFGLIINKCIHLDLPEEIIDQSHLNNTNVSIRTGGPIQTNQMMLLHTCSTLSAQTLQICEGVYLGGDLQFLQEALRNDEGPKINLCFGYSGWESGQLEREFLDGNWFLHPASYQYIFAEKPEKLWQTLLKDMGGKYASLSMIPEDLSVN